MLFLESSARWLLVLHAVLGTGLVAASTHLAVWTRSWPTGHATRARGVRWFGVIVLALYSANFALGNLVYPIYKVRVRAEYFDLLPATTGEAELRAQSRRLVAERNHAPVVEEPRRAPDLRPAARLFDIKEHWAAIGLPLAFVAFFLSRRTLEAGDVWSGRLIFWSAAGAAACAWGAALIGLWVSAIRAIG